MQSSEISDVGSPSSPMKGRRPIRSPRAIAGRDLLDGIKSWSVWGLLSWYDIKQRYRGSVLGPFWLTLTTAITVGALGLLNSQILGIALSSYMPFLSFGMIIWALIGSLVNESATAFTVVEHVIKQIKMPLSIQVYRIVNRNLIVFAHNIPIILVVILTCDVSVGWADLLLIPGLALLILWVVPLSLLLGATGARFRDIPQMIASILQLAFFLTPIMWKPDMLHENARLALFNPFASFLNLIREPLMGNLPDPICWSICGGTVALTWAIAFPFFVRFRARIAYWA